MGLIDNPRWALAVMSHLIEPGDADLDDFLGEHGVAETMRCLEKGDVPERLRRMTVPNLVDGSAEQIARDIKDATEKCGARVVIPTDDEWPEQLRDLQLLNDESDPHTRPPRILWVRGDGNLATLTKKSVAIVGSRNSTSYGDHVAGDISGDLAQRGWPVVSGGATGIDQAAHDGALIAYGATVAVFANGLDQMYPVSGSRLFDRICQRGALVSEWPPSSRPHRHRFLIRNRVIAALAAGTVVVEAERRSGARNTARYAAELERKLMYVPGPVTSSRSEGTHQLAREPWEARLVTNADDVVEELTGELAPWPALHPRERDHLDEAANRVLDCFRSGYVVTSQWIAEQGKIPVQAVEHTLRQLHRSGWVEQWEGRWRMSRRLAC